MMNKFILILILLSFNTYSQTTKTEIDTNNQIIKYNGFIMSYNEKHEQPNWVFYTLTKKDLECKTKVKRGDNFHEDNDIVGGSATLNDYKASGYDRGHLKPAADEQCDAKQSEETFVMSNMSPQDPSFNRGVWKKLEIYVREITMTNDSVQIYVGGVLKDGLKTIGPNKVSVPEFFYKLIYVYKDGNKKTLAYLIPNKKTGTIIASYEVREEELEKVVGINFK